MALAMRNHTFQFYDRLTDSGMTESQARTIIEAIGDLSDMNLKELATKADLKDLATNEKLEATNERLNDLKEDLSTLKVGIEQRFSSLEGSTEKRSSSLEVSIEKKFSSFEVSIEKRLSSFEVSIEKRFSELEVSMEKNTTALHVAIAKASASATKIVLVGFSIPVILSITVLVVSGAFKHLGL